MVWGAFAWPDAAPEPVKSADGSEADYPECDYDANLTPLYEAIEERAWIAVNQFLHSGYWPESLFADKMTPEEQARTWVTRYETRPDGSKKVRWSQLPIHAAVIFGAPSVVIQQLVEAFPQSVRCTDDHRMLPLHLAFRHGSDDSVLALFLEEFPEAVNVRGYKGRLPVECAKKGPNPERGAIIQTILMKNKTAWERKQSAQQLKELYCVKEALKIKSQKVAHLETAIREIKSREHKTRKELAGTMTELKAAKVKSKASDNPSSPADNTAEKLAVRQLVEKLAGLEMATKDLVEKEKATKKELKKTIAELEATKRMKPTDDQVEQFAKLEKVASKEADLLDRNESAKQEVVEPEFESERAGKQEVVNPEPATLEVIKSKEVEKKVPPVITAEKKAKVIATKVVDEKGEELPLITMTPSREDEREKLRQFEEANRVLQQRVLELEATMEIFEAKQQRAQEEFEAVSVPDENNRFTDNQTKQMEALQAEMNVLKANAESTKKELHAALTQLAELKKQQEKAGERSTATYVTEQATNKKMEKKVALLELALKQFEEKATVAKVEMSNIHEALMEDPTVKLTPAQEKHLSLLYAAIKKLDKKAQKTKEELDSAMAELNSFRDKQAKEVAKKAEKENEMVRSMQLANKELEGKIAALEATLKQFEDKASETKEEMEKAVKELKAVDMSVKEAKRAEIEKEMMRTVKKEHEEKIVIPAQKKHFSLLHAAIKKLDKNAKKTKKELDSAIGELNAFKNKGAEAMAKKAERENATVHSLEQVNKELEGKIAALEATMKQFEDKASRTKEEMEQAMNELKAVDINSVTEAKNQELVGKIAVMEATMKQFEEKASKTKQEMEQAMTELKDAESISIAEAKQVEKEKEMLQSMEQAKKELEDKIVTLESTMKQFEDKASKTQEEMEQAMKQLESAAKKAEKENEMLRSMELAKKELEEKIVTPAQKKHFALLYAAIKKLDKNAKKTKKELDSAMAELNTFRNKGAEAVVNKAERENTVVQAMEHVSKELEKKIAALKATMKQFEDKASKTREEMEQAMHELKAGKNNSGAEAKNKELEDKIARLEAAMKQYEEKASNTKEEMEQAMKELKAAENIPVVEAKKAEKEREMLQSMEQAKKELEEKIAKLESSMQQFEDKASKTKDEMEQAMKELKAVDHVSFVKKENEMLRSMEQANKELEEKIVTLEATMKQFEDKASKTKEEMEQAIKDLKASSNISLTSMAESSLTKKQKQHMEILEDTMKKLEERANHTKEQLDQALAELSDLKKKEATYENNSMVSKIGDKAMKDLAKKVQVLQSAMVGFEVKETKTIQELEKAMRELEAVSNKRFEVLAMTSEQSALLAADATFAREVAKLEKKAAKEEKRVAELEEAVQEVVTKSGSTKEELEAAKQLLEDLQKKQDAKDLIPSTKEEKEEDKQDKKRIKELTKKVATLQAAVIGFEVKEARTMKELESTMKQLEDITSKRFEVLEKASAVKEQDTEKLLAAGALAEEKVAILHSAMKDLEQNAAKTHEELERTKLELEAMKASNVAGENINKQVLTSQEVQIKDLNEKISVLQQAVQGFEVKETKTMQELEHTMKQLEELTAKRFEVLQKVAGREIEAAKAAEANKYTQKAAQEEKKVAALEFAMRELESKAYKTKLELERTMKTLEDLEEKQSVLQQDAVGVTKEEKRVMRELVSKVADIQEAVMAYDEKEHKTIQELELTKKELEETKKQVLELKAQQEAADVQKQLDAEIRVIATDDNQSEVQAVEINDAKEEPKERKEANETAKRVTEETLTSLETAIHRLVEQIGSVDDNEEATKPIAPLSCVKHSEEPATAVTVSKPAQSSTSKIAQPANTFQAAAMVKAERRRPSFFIAKLTGVKKVDATKAQAKKAVASTVTDRKAQAKKAVASAAAESKKGTKKLSFGLFGSKKALAFGKTAKKKPTSIPSTPLVVTAEQRKAIEAVHGPDIIAVLTEQQMLDILSKMSNENPAAAPAPTIDPVTLTLTPATIPRSDPEAITAPAPEIQAASDKENGPSTTQNSDNISAPVIEEENPNMMIVSLPSQRSMNSRKSDKSHKSNKSKQSGSSQTTVPTSIPSNKLSTVSPAPEKEAESEMNQKGVLVTAGTYDDGFEINF